MKLTRLTLAALLVVGSFSLSTQAAELPAGPHIVTSGQASVDAVPDMATLSIDVNFSAKEAAEAKKQVDLRVQQYFDFLASNGVDKKDIDAANIRTQPEYDYLKDGKSVLKGYRATRQVQVTLRQLDKLNALLDGALKSELNEIHSVQLGVANPEQYRQQARKEAIADAIKQAGDVAEGFGSQLGRVYSIRYHASSVQPVPMVRMYKAAAAPATSAEQTYEKQSIHFDDSVNVVFELQNNP